MKSSSRIIGAVMLSVASAGSHASDQGVGTSMLCAVTNTVSCDTIGDCLEGPANAVNLPVFLKYYPENKEIVNNVRIVLEGIGIDDMTYYDEPERWAPR